MNHAALSPAIAHEPAHLARPRRADREPDRVRRSTAPAINRAIDRETDRNITRFAAMDDQRIRERINALDRQWDVERVLEANAATLGLGGLVLAATTDKRWLALPGVVLVFLLQHSLQGWCPPLPVLRRLGVRTRGEIDREKYTLLALLETGSPL